jgi:multiple sugar transport system substrate-binding protein
LFANGRAAAIVTDNRSADSRIVVGGEPIVRENLGVASLTETPWCGGGSFVIWKYTQEDRERERGAVDLVKFLVSREAEVQWARGVHSLMARIEAIEDVYPDYHPLRHPVMQMIQTGRTYRVIPLWRRLEYQIANTLNVVVQEARADPSIEAASILQKHLDPLADRLNLTLKG